MKWIYDDKRSEFYDEENPDIRVNLDNKDISIGTDNYINSYYSQIVALYSRGDLTKEQLIKLSEYEDIINRRALGIVLNSMVNHTTTFAEIEKIVEENTEYGKNLAFRSGGMALLFAPDRVNGIRLYDVNFSGLPEYYGRHSYFDCIYNSSLCEKLFHLIYEEGNYDLVIEINNIIKNYSIPIAYERVLKDKYLNNADIDKKIAQKQKMDKYKREIQEIENSLWKEGVYEIGKEGYIISGSDVIYITKEPIPKICSLSMNNAAKIIRRKKFKVYQDMYGLQEFREYTKYANKSYIQTLLKMIKKTNDPIYDEFITFQSL